MNLTRKISRQISLTGKVLLLAVLSVLSVKQSAEAFLTPDEILVVVNTEAPDSERLGKLYIKLRAVPPEHLAEIEAPVQDTISRDQYNELIAAPLRKKIQGLQSKGVKIRCIVTIYGVPLKVAPSKPADFSEEKVNDLNKSQGQKKKEAEKLEEEKKTGNTPEISSRLKQLRDEIKKIDFEIEHLLGNNTRAAVDSELALLLSPQYELDGWQVNPGFYPLRNRIKNSSRIMIVSRLDAPTPATVEKMILTAIDTEKTGLSGKLYLDARGLAGEGAYATFDEDIRQTAKIIEKGSMPVVLDNKPELFGPDKVPSAALYCGWYSLAKYADSFDWVKGAIGYHVASSEAASLHDPNGAYWVKSMLERGVIASIGPVTEPYLTAFPPPSLFFQFLMNGQYSLGEVFAMTNPMLSWQMILVGDPLYNPFRTNPPYPMKDMPQPPY